MQVVLTGFSVILFCFVQTKSLCMYGCMYFLAAHVPLCVMVMLFYMLFIKCATRLCGTIVKKVVCILLLYSSYKLFDSSDRPV